MSLYMLKISGSDEVENIFEWAGSGSLTAPSGYVFESYTSESITNYDPPTELELFGGNFVGYFTGELSGSILLNGKTLDAVINGTDYGSLTILDNRSDIGLVSSSNGYTISGSNIKMSLNNLEDDKQYKYITTLSNNLSGSLLRFTEHAGSEKLEYYINNIEITSSGTSDYANLEVNELYNSIRDSYSTHTASIDIFEDFYYSQWFVDFDLGDKPIVGQVYVNGEKLENVLNQTKYGKILYNTSTDTEVFPTLFHFTTSIPANEWSNTSPIKIAINNRLQGQYTAGFYFEWALNDILENGLIGSIIRFESDVWPLTFKHFRIDNIIEYGWDNTGYFYRTIKSTTPIYDTTLSTKWPAGSPPADPVKYYEMEVTEIASSTDTLDYNSMPEENEFFNVDFEFVERPTKEIVYIDDSKDWTMPDWATKLTVICIGAGGGGGGGGAGYLHEYPHGMWTKFSDYTIPSTVGRTIGHDIIMGGGGGAGGNIAWTVYDNVPPGTQFVSTVGEGGRGSRGCYPNEELEFSLEDGVDASNNIISFYINRRDVTDFIFPEQLQTQKSLYAHDDYKRKLMGDQYSVPSTEDAAIRGITALDSFNPFYAGDNGGYTSFKSKLPTGYQVDVSADGGIGGVTGTGIRHYVHQYHLICWSDWHGYIEALIPGGGSQLTTNTKGQKFLIGGPGGYGISMPYLDKPFIYDSDAAEQKLNFIRSFNELKTDEKRYYRNTAPSLPFKSTDEINTPNFENKQTFNTQPIKYPYYGRSNSTYGNTDLTFFNFSTTFPSDMGNTGGGGGTGKAYYGIFNKPYVGIGPVNIPFETGERDRLPAPFPLSQYTTKVQSITKVGKGGRNINNNDLLAPIDNRFANTVYFGEGGSAGHVEQIMDEVTGDLTTISTILPENGIGKGAGGGGGAGVYSQRDGEYNIGQTGGDGNAGRIILIVER